MITPVIDEIDPMIYFILILLSNMTNKTEQLTHRSLILKCIKKHLLIRITIMFLSLKNFNQALENGLN